MPAIPRNRLRFWLLTSGVPAVVLGSFLAALSGVFSKPDTIGPETYEKIRPGMRREQVEALLGQLDNGLWALDATLLGEKGESGDRSGLASDRWVGPRYMIQVDFDNNSQASSMSLWAVHATCRPGPWDRFKRALRLDKVL